MQLTKEEEGGLDGRSGDAIALAYRILVAIGKATGADRLVPVKWAHVSGVNYNTIGDTGADFLYKFSQHAKFAIKTTINPMGYDLQKPTTYPSDDFVIKQTNIIESYQRMGAIPSFTCIPYEIFDIPKRGTEVSFAESNAAVYSNSVLGLHTNKESALSALASAITGKAPYSDLRIEECRTPKYYIQTENDMNTELDFGLLGFFAGKTVQESSVAIDLNAEGQMDTRKAKALSAAMGTSGSCGMFVIGQAREKISFDKTAYNSVKDQLNTADDGDVITFGSPQLGIQELKLLARMVDGKKFTKPCMIFCARAIHNQAIKIGITGQIEKAGGEFMCDSCTCLTPMISKDMVDSVITNSIKGAYYLNHSNKVNVSLKDMKTIVKENTIQR